MLQSHEGSQLGVLAMSAINEIMYRNCMPVDFEGFLLQLFASAFQLLQTVLSESPASPEKARISLLDDM